MATPTKWLAFDYVFLKLVNQYAKTITENKDTRPQSTMGIYGIHALKGLDLIGGPGGIWTQ